MNKFIATPLGSGELHVNTNVEPLSREQILHSARRMFPQPLLQSLADQTYLLSSKPMLGHGAFELAHSYKKSLDDPLNQPTLTQIQSQTNTFSKELGIFLQAVQLPTLQQSFSNASSSNNTRPSKRPRLS